MFKHEFMRFQILAIKKKHAFLCLMATAFYFFWFCSFGLAYPFATFVMDANSGKELYSQNSKTKLHPASLTKMMTLYLAFHEVEKGSLGLDQKVSISRNAVIEPPSKFGYKVGQKVSIRYLIRAAAIRSANDAATALGEAISGSEAEFAKYMTRTALAMGMHSTSFKNANGLTAVGHLSTARDMAILGRRLLHDFPEYFHLFGRTSVVALGRTLYNTNRKFLASYGGSDGIKTGFTSAAGYNLAASAKRGNKRVIAVVFGSGSVKLRTKRMTELLNIGFAKAQNFGGKIVLNTLNLKLLKRQSRFASGAVFQSAPPLVRPKIFESSLLPNVREINELIEGILLSGALENVSWSDTSKPLPRPSSIIRGQDMNSGNFSREKIESKLLNILESEDLQRSFSILVGSYFTDFNAKKDLSRLTLVDMETLGGSKRGITTGVVDQKKVFRVSFVGLKKSEAIKACQKLMARNELCEIYKIDE